MSWPITFLIALLLLLLWNTLDQIGIFTYLERRLNAPATPAVRSDFAAFNDELLSDITNVRRDIGSLKNDIDKLKLALGFKEFKSKG